MYAEKTSLPVVGTRSVPDKGLLALAWVSIFWGTTYLVSKIGVQYTHGLLLAGIRQLVAGILIVTFMWFRGVALPNRQTLRRLTIIGVLMLFGSNGLLTWSMQYIPSGLGAIVAATVPLWITLLSLLLLGSSRLSLKRIAGLLIGFAGVAGIFYGHWKDLFVPEFRLGVGLALLACLCWALGSVLSARWKPDVSPLLGASIQMLVGGAAMITTAWATQPKLIFAAWNGEFWFSLIYLIIVGSVITYTAYVYALSKLPPPLVAVYAYVNPLVAVGLGWIFLHEQLSWPTLFAGLTALLGVYLVNASYKTAK